VGVFGCYLCVWVSGGVSSLISYLSLFFRFSVSFASVETA